MLKTIGLCLILFLLFIVYSCCIVSSKCSGEEEDTINMK
jgi:hypothetical protein